MELREHCDNLEAEVKRLKREKDARVYYQNIVYSVCNFIDRLDGKDGPGDSGVVCGTIETPHRGVQDALTRIRRNINQLRKTAAAVVELRDSVNWWGIPTDVEADNIDKAVENLRIAAGIESLTADETGVDAPAAIR